MKLPQSEIKIGRVIFTAHVKKRAENSARLKCKFTHAIMYGSWPLHALWRVQWKHNQSHVPAWNVSGTNFARQK